ncbi:hypothetical protein ILUMI_01315 [Ignelater luminosus]|uniref:Arrestin C-terminal-like domain-containing protein n=1 Tax=Ignelater luminosus TaxID=2038154 RepID=A0A8K0GLU2_IGNLU|nr:hypothetical protein ILUMI_01315 [Ignelater luminosus]
MSSVHVYLDNDNGYCYPGQTIAGRVECCFDKHTKLRAVRISFKGRAETEWTESESYYDSSNERSETRNVRYHAQEEYFNAEYNLVQGGNDFFFPPGRHTYPFSYILPAYLPSSFEGRNGNIRYYIKAVVERSWKSNYEHLFSLNVVSPLDLNYVPGVRDPVATSVDKTMCSCWCNESGELTFEMSLPATGFVPGQEVNIGAHIENLTNVSAKCVKFKIIGNVEFIAHFPSTKIKSDERVIVECKAGGVGAHDDKSWTSALTIPGGFPYPNLIPCSIINLSYHLKAKVVVPWPHTNLRNEVPILIGTIPLTGVATTFSASPPTLPAPTERTPLLSNACPYSNNALCYFSGKVDFEKYESPVPIPVGVPYPSKGAPYAPSTSNGFDKKSPSAPSPDGAPYPSNLINSAGPSEAPHPSAPSISAPYTTGPGGLTYPSEGFSNPCGPSEHEGAPYLVTSNSNSAPPSYEKAKKQKKKNGKSG